MEYVVCVKEGYRFNNYYILYYILQKLMYDSFKAFALDTQYTKSIHTPFNKKYLITTKR